MQKVGTNSFQKVLEAVLFGGWSIPPTAHGCDRIPSTTPGAEPPRDAKDSGSARSHSTHLETSSSNRPLKVTYPERHTVPRPNIRYVHAMDVTHAMFHARTARTAVSK